jgi:tetratricopeptide (TPR) repeat protein
MSLAECYRILYEFNPNSEIYFEKMLDNSIKAISWGKFFNEDISNAYLTVARGYETKKNYEKSIQFYKLYINLKPNDPVGYRELGDIYYDAKLYEPAFAAYLLAVKYAPYDVDSICRISELSKKLNAYEEYKEYEVACIEFNNILSKQEEDIEETQTTSTSQTTEPKNTPGFEIGAVSAAALLVSYYLKRRK